VRLRSPDVCRQEQSWERLLVSMAGKAGQSKHMTHTTYSSTTSITICLSFGFSAAAFRAITPTCFDSQFLFTVRLAAIQRVQSHQRHHTSKVMASASDSMPPVKAACHCGAVTILTPGRPREINECQCTICRRYAAAWAYYDPKEVRISVTDSSPTRKYVWGDCELEFHFCSVCGCVTHWKSVEESDKIGVNTRMMDPEDVKTVSRRISFGMLSTPLRSKEAAHVDDKAQY